MASEPGRGFEPGFRIARRGYAHDQVDAYLSQLAGPTPPVDPPAFDVVRRGYDVDQVDEYIAKRRAERGLGR